MRGMKQECCRDLEIQEGVGVGFAVPFLFLVVHIIDGGSRRRDDSGRCRIADVLVSLSFCGY